MSWVKIDDQMPQHPKIMFVGPLGLAIQVAALCYCSRYLTDGFLPAEALGTLIDLREFQEERPTTPESIAKWMTNAGIWKKVRGGYQVHAYLEYNPSRADVMVKRQEIKQSRSNAGRKGAASRWQKHGPDPDPLPEPLDRKGKVDLKNHSVEASATPSPRARFFSETNVGKQTGALIRHFKANGLDLTKQQRDRLGKLVKDYGHGRTVFDAAVWSLTAEGDPIDLMTRRLQGEGHQQRAQGKQALGGASGYSGSYPPGSDQNPFGSGDDWRRARKAAATEATGSRSGAGAGEGGPLPEQGR